MTLANWVRAQTGTDPAPQLRGHYHTRLGWLRIVNRAGGLVALVGALAERAGLVPLSAPHAGDIAIVMLPGAGEAGAIRTDRRWVLKIRLGGGLSAGTPRVLQAWGLRPAAVLSQTR
jgi:hypothetical protein